MEEQIVFIAEIEVDCRWRMIDSCRQPTHGKLGVPFLSEQRQSCLQDLGFEFFLMFLLPLFIGHN